MGCLLLAQTSNPWPVTFGLLVLVAYFAGLAVGCMVGWVCQLFGGVLHEVTDLEVGD